VPRNPGLKDGAPSALGNQSRNVTVEIILENERALLLGGAVSPRRVSAERVLAFAGRINATPSGLCHFISDPRVARASQPWAERRSTFGAREPVAQCDRGNHIRKRARSSPWWRCFITARECSTGNSDLQPGGACYLDGTYKPLPRGLPSREIMDPGTAEATSPIQAAQRPTLPYTKAAAQDAVNADNSNN